MSKSMPAATVAATKKMTTTVETGPRLLWAEAVLRKLSAENLTEGGNLDLKRLFTFANMSQTYGEYLRAVFNGKKSVAERRHRDLVNACRFDVTRELYPKHKKKVDVLYDQLQEVDVAIDKKKAKEADREPLVSTIDKLEAAHERAKERLLAKHGIPSWA